MFMYKIFVTTLYHLYITTAYTEYEIIMGRSNINAPAIKCQDKNYFRSTPLMVSFFRLSAWFDFLFKVQNLNRLIFKLFCILKLESRPMNKDCY